MCPQVGGTAFQPLADAILSNAQLEPTNQRLELNLSLWCSLATNIPSPPFQVNLELERSGDDLHMHFPITIATVPFRIPNSNQQPSIHYGTSPSPPPLPAQHTLRYVPLP